MTRELTLRTSVASAMATLFASLSANAHVPFIEPQTLAQHPWKYVDELAAMPELLEALAEENGADTPCEFSFETPFVVGPALQAANPIDPECRVEPDDPFTLPRLSVEDSQAVFGYLTKHDVDVFKFTVAPQDLIEGPVIIAASALPPACRQTRNNYPVTALIGTGFIVPPPPAGTDPDPTIPLPPEVQDFLDANPAFDIIVAPNPYVHPSEPRPIFDTDVADPGSPLGLSWLLPVGLECLADFTVPCDFSNTISAAAVAPGDYYLAMWDPAGKKQDYTANIGFGEDLTSCYLDNDNREVILELVQDGALLHRPCTDPRP